MVASDRISTYDVVHPTAIPDKGKVLTGLSVLWFDLTKEIVPNHLISATDGVPNEFRGRGLRVKRLRMLPVECVVRGYLSGSGWKDYQATGRVSGIELPGGPARVRAAPRADLHAVDEGRGGPRRGDRLRAGGVARRVAGAGRAAARRLARGLRAHRRVRARARDHPRRHEVRVRARRGRYADARRRGLHAGLVALLARRPLRGRARAAELRQAVRARLGVRDRVGQGAARADDPGRRRGGDPRALRGRLRAALRRAVLGLAGSRGEGAGADPAQGRDPRPAGPGGRARAARRSGSTAWPTCTSAVWSSSTSTIRRGCRRCASGCSPIP